VTGRRLRLPVVAGNTARAERRQQGVRRPTGLAAPPAEKEPAAAAGLADVAPIAPPEAHRRRAAGTVRPRHLDVLAGRRVGVGRERAGPYDCHRQQHRLGPLRVGRQTQSGRGPSRSGTAHPILASDRAVGPSNTSPKSTAGRRPAVFRNSRRQHPSAPPIHGTSMAHPLRFAEVRRRRHTSPEQPSRFRQVRPNPGLLTQGP
jgi:hypothetical protein